MFPHSPGAAQTLPVGEGKASTSLFCCAKPRVYGKLGTSVLWRLHICLLLDTDLWIEHET